MVNPFVLTKKVLNTFRSRETHLVCYRCGRRFQEGDRIVSRTGGRSLVNKRYHLECYEGLFLETPEAPALTKKKALQLVPGYYPRKRAPHVALKRGVFSKNPGEVLCPTLANGEFCRKHRKGGEWFRPEFLIRHHSDPSLEL